jgi:hypothetical protein
MHKFLNNANPPPPPRKKKLLYIYAYKKTFCLKICEVFRKASLHKMRTHYLNSTFRSFQTNKEL